jgi:glycosyltransferase involved in cell wall biosynthesis
MILVMGGGGAERQLSYLLPELSRRGHDVHLASVRAGVNEDRLAGSRCHIHYLGASGKYDPRVFTRALSLTRRVDPDIVHTWLTHLDIIGGGVARLLRIPWVISERSAALSYPPTVLNRLRVAVGRGASHVVANSSGGAEYWRSQGFPSVRIDIVPNMISVAEFEAAPPLDDPRIAPDDELVLYVGRFSPEKNVAMLLDAMQHVLRMRPKAKLALCGEGPLYGELMNQAEVAGIGERVVFAGFVPDVASWMKRAAAMAAVSTFEGEPNVVLEAMVAGVPLVTSDIPAYRAILSEESASFVAVSNPIATAGAIVQTLQERDAALRRAARAREWVASRALAPTVTMLENVYGRVRAARRTQST